MYLCTVTTLTTSVAQSRSLDKKHSRCRHAKSRSSPLAGSDVSGKPGSADGVGVGGTCTKESTTADIGVVALFPNFSKIEKPKQRYGRLGMLMKKKRDQKLID